MRKYILYLLGIIALCAAGALSVQAACTGNFPTSLSNFGAGNTICSSWANNLETKIGIDNSADTTSLDYKASHNLGSFITATSTAFYPLSSNPGAYVTATSTTFYLASNPGAYVTATSTAFYLASNPGAFVTATSTAFYPYTGNPGAYITATGTSATVSGVSGGFWGYASTSFAFGKGAGSSTITVSDPSNAYKFDKQYGRGTVFRWTEGSTVKLAVVATSSYATNVVTLSLIGDYIMSSSTATSTLEYAAQKATAVVLTYAGTLSTSTDIMGHAYLSQDTHIFGVDAFDATPGTTLATTFQLFNSSTTNLFATDPYIAASASTTPGQRTLDQTVLTAGSFISANVSAIPNNPPVDLYLNVLTFPENYKYLP